MTAIASDLDQELVKILIAKVLRALPKFALEIAAQTQVEYGEVGLIGLPVELIVSDLNQELVEVEAAKDLICILILVLEMNAQFCPLWMELGEVGQFGQHVEVTV